MDNVYSALLDAATDSTDQSVEKITAMIGQQEYMVYGDAVTPFIIEGAVCIFASGDVMVSVLVGDDNGGFWPPVTMTLVELAQAMDDA